MIFKRIVLHNFGLYKGRHEIDLEPPASNKPIILFGGLNGGGKTTFLTAIQLALYGKFSSSTNGNRAYEKVLKDFINRDVNPSDGAAIELEIQHFVDGVIENIEIFRSWRKAGKSISETFEVRRNGQDDPVLADRWYEVVDGLIPSRLSHLFFFDGEKIESLAEKSASARFLKAGLHDLLGLDLVSTLISDLKVNEGRTLIRDVKDSTLQEELTKAEEVVIVLGNKTTALKFDQGRINNQLEDVGKREGIAKKKYRALGGDLLDQRESILTERERLAHELHHIDETLREIASGPAPLLLVQDLLADVIAEASREEETLNQQAVVSVLSQRDASILETLKNQKKDNETVKSLEKLFKQDIKARNAVADREVHLGVSPAELSPFSPDHLSPISEKIERLTNHRDLVESRKADQDRLLEGMPDPEGLEGMTSELAQLEEEKFRAEIEKNVVEEEIDSNSTAIERAVEALERVQTKSTESKFASERLLRSWINTSKKAKAVLSKFQKELTTSHIKRLEDLIMESFRQLLRKRMLVESIEICPETYELRLLTSAGKLVPARSLSAGERQLLSVAILWGLGKASGRPIPTIVDTPLGRLDGSHRLKLVENYFPLAAHQVILLSTDEEISGDLYERLKPAIGHEYMLTFNEDSASTEVSTGYEFRGAA